MKSFAHHNARSIKEAITLLTRYKGKAKLIAGGTDLLGILKEESLADSPEALINIKTIPGLDHIKEDEAGLKIGTLTKLSAIASSSTIKPHYAMLSEAARSVATPQIRNMGTIGGNLCQETRCWYYRYPHQLGGRIICARKGKGPCYAVKGDNRYHAIIGGKRCFSVCPSDLAIALTTLDARIRVARPAGERVVAVADLYEAMRPLLKPDEIVTAILVPKPPDNARQSFLKFRLRGAVDFAIVSVGSLIAIRDGVCEDARIVLGAVASAPYRARAAEDAIRGKFLDEAAAEEAAEAAVIDTRPLSKNAYKVEIAKALVKRIILSSQDH
jgi:xanthine dehydrogenase YagS FAD-binding subunit